MSRGFEMSCYPGYQVDEAMEAGVKCSALKLGRGQSSFAQVALFKSNQHMSVVAAHERAGVCERAFLEGYRSQLS